MIPSPIALVSPSCLQSLLGSLLLQGLAPSRRREAALKALSRALLLLHCESPRIRWTPDAPATLRHLPPKLTVWHARCRQKVTKKELKDGKLHANPKKLQKQIKGRRYGRANY